MCIQVLIHCSEHTLKYVYKHVDGVPSFNKIPFKHVFLEMKKTITETAISLAEMTIINVHVVVSNPIQPTAVLAEIKHFSIVILADLLQSQLACNSWFYIKAVVATLTTNYYRTIDFLGLDFGQLTAVSGTIDFLGLDFGYLTAVPGKGNSLLHITNGIVDPFHGDAIYSTTTSWYDETISNRNVSTNIFHITHFYAQPDSQSHAVIITWMASIAYCLVVPVSSFNPIQNSFGHPITPLLTQLYTIIRNLTHILVPHSAPRGGICASSSVKPLHSLGGDTQRISNRKNMGKRKLITNLPRKIVTHVKWVLLSEANLVSTDGNKLYYEPSVPVFGFEFCYIVVTIKVIDSMH